MTLGQLFLSRRSELGRSLEQISVSTKIHVKVLKALEDDQYSQLPARTFTRGFISAYCRALKLNPEQTLQDYHDFLESKFAERPDRDQGHQGYVFEGKELEQNKRWLIFGASIASVFAIAVLLVFKPQNHKRKEKHKDFVEDSATPGESTEGTTPDAEIIPSPVLTNANNDVKIPMAMSAAGETSSSARAIVPSFPIATNTPTATPTPAVKPSAAPVVAPPVASTTSAPIVASPAPTAVPIASLPAFPAASPSATPKEDKLHKGDELTPAETKRKVTFQAAEDVWVRYQADQKPVSMIILRKGRMLVIKAKEKIRVETNHPEALKYRGRDATFRDLSQGQISVETKGAIVPDTGAPLSSEAIPVTVPPSNNR